jgi:hypothetical protein
MIQKKIRTSSTSVRFFWSESIQVLSQIHSFENIENELSLVDYNSVLVNAESTKKRIINELKFRLPKIENVLKLIEFNQLGIADQKAVLFYSMCKSQPLIVDCSLMVLREKVKNLDLELSTYEVEQFIYRMAAVSTELDHLSADYTQEMASRIRKLYVDVEILKDNSLQTLEVSESLLKLIIKEGDAWFLDVLLMKDFEKEKLLTND